MNDPISKLSKVENFARKVLRFCEGHNGSVGFLSGKIVYNIAARVFFFLKNYSFFIHFDS